MSQSAALQLLVNEVRPKTIRLLEDASEKELRWAPPGLSNHILWHAGHALWLGDVLCLEPILKKSTLPGAWAATFGQHCKPVKQTSVWPARAQVVSALRAQQRVIIGELGKLLDEELDQPMSRTSRSTLAQWITHAFHDEANHQGEMHLLLKMQRV